MKKTITILIILILIVLGVWLWGTGTSQQGAADGTGTVVFAVTDAAADMGAIEKFNVTLSGVRLHSEADGWVDVETDEKTFDLLKLKADGTLALLAEANVATGTYDQVRLEVSDPEVVKTDDTTAQARIPSGELKLAGTVTVEEGSSSSVTLDFLADKSLHVTGNGEYIFTPVVKLETRSGADVRVENNGTVKIRGGEKKSEKTVSMGADGRVKAGLQIPEQAAVEVMEDGTLKVTPSGNGGNAPTGAGADNRGESSDRSEPYVAGENPSPDVDADAEVNPGAGGAGAEAGAGASGGVQY